MQDAMMEWKSPMEHPETGREVDVLMYAGDVANPEHPGYPGKPWIERVTHVAQGSTSGLHGKAVFFCELIQTGSAIAWRYAPASASEGVLTPLAICLHKALHDLLAMPQGDGTQATSIIRRQAKRAARAALAQAAQAGMEASSSDGVIWCDCGDGYTSGEFDCNGDCPNCAPATVSVADREPRSPDLPTCPQSIIALITAYGDARADQKLDEIGDLLSRCVVEIRKQFALRRDAQSSVMVPRAEYDRLQKLVSSQGIRLMEYE